MRSALFAAALTWLASAPAWAASVLLFGASGETGVEVAKLLAARGDHVIAFVRPTSDRTPLDPLGVEYVVGDALHADDVRAAFAGREISAVVSAIGARRGESPPDLETSRNIIDAAKAAGVQRLILTTVIGTGDSAVTLSQRAKEFLGTTIALKTEAEEYLKASGLEWTILRPGGLISEPATGRGELVEDHTATGSIMRADLAALIVRCLDDPATVGKTFHTIDRDTITHTPIEPR